VVLRQDRQFQIPGRVSELYYNNSRNECFLRSVCRGFKIPVEIFPEASHPSEIPQCPSIARTDSLALDSVLSAELADVASVLGDLSQT